MTFTRIPAGLCAALVALSACQQDTSVLNTNFQFSNAAALGTQNAGLYEPGSTFLWNTSTNRLEFLDTLELTPSTPGGVAAGDNVAEMGISGLPETLFGKEGLVKASIGGNRSSSPRAPGARITATRSPRSGNMSRTSSRRAMIPT